MINSMGETYGQHMGRHCQGDVRDICYNHIISLKSVLAQWAMDVI